MIYRKVNLLCQKLDENLVKRGVVELRKTYLALTTDILADHAFGKSLDLLLEDQKANDWKRTIKAVAILTPLIKQFTWIIPIALIIPLRLLHIVVPVLARIVALRHVRANTHHTTHSLTGSRAEANNSVGHERQGSCSHKQPESPGPRVNAVVPRPSIPET